MRPLPEELIDAMDADQLALEGPHSAARFAHHWTASKYEQRIAKAVEVLKDLEWRADYHEYRCSMCNHPNPNHEADCALAAVLKENES
jgi:hypothetical protein